MTDKSFEYGIFVLAVAAIVIFLAALSKMEKECESKGGVFLSEEMKCVSGIILIQ